jgi:beta-glucanase (GH16 family)
MTHPTHRWMSAVATLATVSGRAAPCLATACLLLPACAAPAAAAAAPQSVAQTPPAACMPISKAPLVHQNFHPWAGKISPDGIWRINGLWVGVGGNTIDPSLAKLTWDFDKKTTGFMSMTVDANQLRGSELQTITSPGYNYGYYEARMMPSSVPGVVDSFFWIQAPNYGPLEIDIEFLTKEFTSTSGTVHFTIHPSNKTYIQTLNFNPAAAFHKYGFLWTPGTAEFYVDGQPVVSLSDSTLTSTVGGFIMANTWTGNPNWGAGPPTSNATSVYDWLLFYPYQSGASTHC